MTTKYLEKFEIKIERTFVNRKFQLKILFHKELQHKEIGHDKNL